MVTEVVGSGVKLQTTENGYVKVVFDLGEYLENGSQNYNWYYGYSAHFLPVPSITKWVDSSTKKRIPPHRVRISFDFVIGPSQSTNSDTKQVMWSYFPLFEIQQPASSTDTSLLKYYNTDSNTVSHQYITLYSGSTYHIVMDALFVSVDGSKHYETTVMKIVKDGTTEYHGCYRVYNYPTYEYQPIFISPHYVGRLGDKTKQIWISTKPDTYITNFKIESWLPAVEVFV